MWWNAAAVEDVGSCHSFLSPIVAFLAGVVSTCVAVAIYPQMAMTLNAWWKRAVPLISSVYASAMAKFGGPDAGKVVDGDSTEPSAVQDAPTKSSKAQARREKSKLKLSSRLKKGPFARLKGKMSPAPKRLKSLSDDEADAGVGKPATSPAADAADVVETLEKKGPPPSLPPKPKSISPVSSTVSSGSNSDAASQKAPSLYARACDKMSDATELEDLIQCYSFARVFTSKFDPKSGQQTLRCSRVPVILSKENPTDAGYLEFHLAHANSQWKDFDENREVLVTFDGPHAYVSPNYYSKLQNLPTWNYASVQCLGFPTIVSNVSEKMDSVSRLVQQNEMMSGQQAPWNMKLGGYSGSDLKYIVCVRIRITKMEGKMKLSQYKSGGYSGSDLKYIVCVRIRITKMEGKMKLSQHKSKTDFKWLHDAFVERAKQHSGGDDFRALSQLMEMKYSKKLKS